MGMPQIEVTSHCLNFRGTTNDKAAGKPLPGNPEFLVAS
jgi:hypothetical protein